jgi:hypothetical protein
LSPLQALEERLRANGPDELPTYVSGPVVALGATHPHAEVSCGDAAVNDARTWGTMLSDRAYPPATCYAPGPGTRFVCMQTRSGTALVLVFDDPESPRLLAGIESATPRGPEIDRSRALLDSATCP